MKTNATQPRFSVLLLMFLLGSFGMVKGQELFPVRGFCIAAPGTAQLSTFIRFIDEELASRKVNTLVLRVDFNYQFKSRSELSEIGALSKKDVQKIVEVCKKHGIRVIPQINLLGHQSWANKTGNLLKIYPEFDETPHVKIPEKYEWPNADGLYCKSYCPLHPDVHKVVFAMVDEICDVFEADAFHAGMDEVFYIGDDKCPRCSGRDKAELFANEVNKISNHLSLKKRQLWIWGDRLLDGKVTGLGAWEASMNNTHRAVDLIDKGVMICDWHYERPDQTAVYFAMKGLSVITCPWRKPDNAVAQAKDLVNSRKQATPELKSRLQGMMQTVWSGADSFLDEFYGKKVASAESESACFRALFAEINNNQMPKP
ncbi:family 20 glycosylhydrolase [Pedobacter hiemivivus]|uniref:beta-N-acetylhexosaminidase n=1 Tax=Pedobacter hiemivivus TaxID=2530454 RepID=A0A4R0N0M9_9SPHI|nr:family 20 glycosylhydrolase [Pedobacter hiemivivus]TCC93185.1 glycoside hydrolase [Pedobacter hiemivivus]